ncbi:hypothetical protein KSF_039400 [Reticulibacter mediterranei]|uniref:Secreted protein n=1 Tax=Reticulibacter mediterranei TaxID=2778369 RepID=A0A8J3N1E5_9CHLR|nr:hypothetical protein [Reticulibacter mediterranei]GHO93892.1 hypothetical protein KSF_039400 [Reticulibacter mediterranei]
MYYLKTGLKKYRWRLIPQLLLAAIVAVVLAAGSAQTSQAASLAPQVGGDTTHCANPGALVDVYPITAHDTRIGEVDLYYNRSTGYNCAWTRASGPASSGTKEMRVFLDVCGKAVGDPSDHTAPSGTTNKPGVPCNPSEQDYDTGNYHSYAGPVAVSAKGVCIAITGSIQWKGTVYWGGSDSKTSHCGS